MKYFETEKIELKRNLNETFEKEVVAFLNTHDGVIYIGVEDNGEICGVAELDETMKKISDIISTGILPNPQELVCVSAKYEEAKFIIEVQVKKGSSLYYINEITPTSIINPYMHFVKIYTLVITYFYMFIYVVLNNLLSFTYIICFTYKL